MTHLQKSVWRLGLAVALATAVSACSSNSNTSPPAGGGETTIRQEDRGGTQFGVAFRADNNSEPFTPTDGDVLAVSLTTEPFDVK